MNPTWLAIGVPVLFATIVFLVIRQVKRQQKALVDALRRRGFTPLERLSETELERVQALRRRSQANVGVTKIYEYRHLEYRLLRFDIASKNSDNHDSTQYAVIDARLNLPRFSVVPNMKLPGFLNALWSKLLEQIVKRIGLTEVELPGSPQFNEKYMLLGTEDGAKLKDQAFSLWDRVAGLPHPVMVDAQGDMLLYQTLQLPSDRGRRRARVDVDDEIRTHLELGEQLHAIFRDAFTQAPAVPAWRPR
jgi:hypothetical protein